MKARVKWVENSLFVAQSGSGHSVVLDGPPESGGQNLGVRPMEMVLLGLGGCTAFDVVDILRKKREDISDCVVDITAERAETVPKIFTKIHLHYIVSGKDVKEESVKRAVELSAEKYCSVSMMLNKTAELTHDYEIVQAD
ncbi:MAG TPA: OsmC family protein [Gammaproteobacteria bacterium]|nr:OsmC family protein [Gammaproteobacteria bacterium]